MKRSRSPHLVENPFVKDENKQWVVKLPPSLSSRVSPPPIPKRQKSVTSNCPCKGPSTAIVEAGKASVEDHLVYFSKKLSQATRATIPGVPRLSQDEWIDLYQRNQQPDGHHFIIHQHDHPVAGTHYDLRLQCNQTSSISFAIMYGLPGDPNSRRLNRNATETRVHNLWNHLIETASHSTGSMLIWDTGEYSVLPYRAPNISPRTDDSDSSQPTEENVRLSESEKLAKAFGQRKVRLRLHGTRLPKGYTISLRLTQDNFKDVQPRRPSRRRRRTDPRRQKKQNVETTSDTDGSSSTIAGEGKNHLASLAKTASPPPKKSGDYGDKVIALASEDEDETIRLNNAYTGATNSIGSIHQRRWYLSLDRENSGFVPDGRRQDGPKRWVRRQGGDGEFKGFSKFIVMGRDHERSVVTGRLAKDVLKDEGVEGYVPRGLWRPVTE